MASWDYDAAACDVTRAVEYVPARMDDLVPTDVSPARIDRDLVLDPN